MSPAAPTGTPCHVAKLVLDCQDVPDTGRGSLHGDIRLAVAIEVAGHGNVVRQPPLERHGCGEARARLLDVPDASRGTVHGDIRLAVTIEVAGHGNVVRSTPTGSPRTSRSPCSTAGCTRHRSRVDTPPSPAGRRHRSRPAPARLRQAPLERTNVPVPPKPVLDCRMYQVPVRGPEHGEIGDAVAVVVPRHGNVAQPGPIGR